MDFVTLQVYSGGVTKKMKEITDLLKTGTDWRELIKRGFPYRQVLRGRHLLKLPTSTTRKFDLTPYDHLPVSRQRKLQLAYRAAGLCEICGQPRANAHHCARHAVLVRDRQYRVRHPVA